MGLFSGMLCHEVLIEPFTAQSATGFKGAATYGTAITYPCRIEYKNRRVIAQDGNQRLSQGRVIIEGEVTIDIQSRITLPDGFRPRRPPIISIDFNAGLFGAGAETVVNF